jgi:hypothetical protein
LNIRKLSAFPALSFAISLAMSTSAMGADISEAQYKKAEQGISARHTADQAACESMAGNRKDVCMAEAKGRESVAKAELELSYGDSAEHRQDVRLAKANAAHAIANEKCDELGGNAQDVCRKEAQSAQVAAKADAERIQTTAVANATARDATAEAGNKASAEKDDAAYAVAKEKCDTLAGDAQDTCIKEAKARHDQS